ncbi:MAG: NAD-dependent protein deacetylase [Myxococcales bacterium]|nr:NAD-dependent protein deacetylase [Myxococcales bacterium]
MPRENPYSPPQDFFRQNLSSDWPENVRPTGYYDASQLEEGVHRLAALLKERRVTALTGAGCSTDSGIPDYRGKESQKRKRNPIQYQHFIHDLDARRRYWARSFMGWPRFRDTQPNLNHQILARLEAQKHILGIITQNVDRLHHKAGSQHIVELHGALADVRCLDCGLFEPRDELQHRMESLNPSWHTEILALAPDGDADLPQDAYDQFAIAPCIRCQGRLKPHVVFFGENVEREIVDAAWKMVNDADLLLVLGSSLTVYSGYRFVKGAAEQQKPVAIINLGNTRGDPHAAIRLDTPLNDTLQKLETLL